MSGQRNPMSQATFDKLTKQLEHLKKVDRPEVISEIATSRAQEGDLNENIGYQAAKDKQARIESKIGIIEDKLARAEIITESASESNHIIFGATVEVRDLGTDEKMKYTLVGPDGINLAEKKISSKSPIGKGLMGKKKGDKVEIETPKGILKLEVLEFY
ncbi:transcription elongation factor GreA [Fibrobacterota bacterium]